MDEYSWLFEVLDPDDLEGLELTDIDEVLENAIVHDIEDEDVEKLLKCALCPNMCEFACPVLEAKGRETVSPSRKAKLGFFYSCGNLTGPELDDNHLYCLSCDACEEHCPFGYSVNDLLIPVRRSLVEEGEVNEEIEKIGDNLRANGTIYEEIDEDDFEELSSEDSDTLYFRSCVARKKSPELVDSTVELLASLNDRPMVMEEEVCCGGPARFLGFEDIFLELAERNESILNESGAERVICSCPTCVYMFREVYPEYGFEIEPDVLHIVEYLDGKLDGKSPKLPEVKEVTFHDPCTLARGLGVVEEPREILSGIENLSFSEPFYNKEQTQCCGYGGPLQLINEELANDIASNRTGQLEECSDSVITCCPSCKQALGEASDELEVIGLSEILIEALKE